MAEQSRLYSQQAPLVKYPGSSVAITGTTLLKVKFRLLFACVWLAVALGSAGTLLAAPGQVKGIVLDDYGVAVAGIGVEALPADRGYDISPPRARTDSQGHFILDLTKWATESPSKWRIYARDEARFYPRPSTFYGESEKSASTVTISSGTSPKFR
jgi:hypothetical protein